MCAYLLKPTCIERILIDIFIKLFVIDDKYVYQAAWHADALTVPTRNPTATDTKLETSMLPFTE